MNTIKRFDAIDFLRGLVIILMTLDHVREIFHTIPIDDPIPENFGIELYLTRWVSHFCAPVFVFLAGLSVYLQKEISGLSRQQVQWMLLKRGLFLMAVEFLIISYFWNVGFDRHPYVIDAQVIWAIACSMLFLAIMLYFPFWFIVVISIIILLFHNFSDGISGNNFFWNIFFKSHDYRLTDGLVFRTVYPLISWFGIIGLGFVAGRLFLKGVPPVKLNSRWILWVSVTSLAIGIILRLTLNYGDPFSWSHHQNLTLTLMDFFNVEKYPPSLDFTLLTLPLGLIALCIANSFNKCWIIDKIKIYGQVPFFYYVTHLGLVVITDKVCGFIFDSHWHRYQTSSLFFIWSMTGCLILLLYIPCLWFSGFKQRNKHQYPLLKYL